MIADMRLRHLIAAGLAAAAAATPAQAADIVFTPDVLDASPETGVTRGAADITFTFDATAPATGFACGLDTEILTPCTSPVSLTGLPDGLHAFRVQATDAGGPGPVAVRYWRVDTTGPAGLSLLAPAQDAVLTSGAVRLEWVPATDTTPLGPALGGYEVRFDGRRIADPAAQQDPPFASPGGTVVAPSFTTTDGTHTWSVTAIDALGNRSATLAGRFTVAEPPVGGLATTQSLWLSTQPVSLTAGATDNGPGTLTYDWDLDGDGTFETPTGVATTITRRFPPGVRTVGVRVTDAGGLTDTAATSFTVIPGPPPGRIGVSVAGGARYVRGLEVPLDMVWPAYARRIVLSNDGGFRPGATRPLAARVTWRLPSGLDGPRTVYVRFPRPGGPDRVYQDDVIVDRAAPEIERVPIGSGWGISAFDATSGVAELQTAAAGRVGPWVVFGSRRASLALGRAQRARVRDRAGNVSAWLRVR